MNYLYMIKFPNNKLYIGITRNFKQRKKDHKKMYKKTLRGKNNNQKKLYTAMEHFGWDTLKWKIVCISPSENSIFLLEAIYIKKYNTTNELFGYNTLLGGHKGRRGLKHSEETKRKMSVARKGYKHTTETKKIISEWATERMSNPENNPMYGKTHTVEARIKIGKDSRERNQGNNNPMHKKGGHTKEAKRKMRIVRQQKGSAKLNEEKVLLIRSLYKTGNYSYKDISIQFNVCPQTICSIVNNKLWKDI